MPPPQQEQERLGPGSAAPDGAPAAASWAAMPEPRPLNEGAAPAPAGPAAAPLSGAPGPPGAAGARPPGRVLCLGPEQAAPGAGPCPGVQRPSTPDAYEGAAAPLTLHAVLGLGAERRHGLCWLDEGTALVAAGGAALLLDVATGRQTLVGAPGGGAVACLAVHPSRRFFALAGAPLCKRRAAGRRPPQGRQRAGTRRPRRAGCAARRPRVRVPRAARGGRAARRCGARVLRGGLQPGRAPPGHRGRRARLHRHRLGLAGAPFLAAARTLARSARLCLQKVERGAGGRRGARRPLARRRGRGAGVVGRGARHVCAGRRGPREHMALRGHLHRRQAAGRAGALGAARAGGRGRAGGPARAPGARCARALSIRRAGRSKRRARRRRS